LCLSYPNPSFMLSPAAKSCDTFMVGKYFEGVRYLENRGKSKTTNMDVSVSVLNMDLIQVSVHYMRVKENTGFIINLRNNITSWVQFILKLFSSDLHNLYLPSKKKKKCIFILLFFFIKRENMGIWYPLILSVNL